MASRGTQVAIGVFGCLGVTMVGGLVCCGGTAFAGVLVLMLAPGWALSFFTEPQPLNVTVPPADPVRAAEAQRQLSAAMADPTLTAHVLPQDLLDPLWTDHQKVPVLSAQIDAQQRLVFDLSVNLDPGTYVNVHARMPTLVVKHGWFEKLTVDELVLSGWDLSGAMAGQDIAMNLNQQLAQERQKNKDLDAQLAALALVQVTNGMLDVQFEPGTMPAPTPAPTDPAVPGVTPPPPVPPADPALPAPAQPAVP